MYYEDESNLYHYSYRKGDSNIVEPVYNTRNLAEEQEPAAAEPRRKNRTWAKVTALALSCALLGGAAGVGAMTVLGGRSSAANVSDASVISLSDREPTEVEIVSAVAGTTKLSLSELYNANVNSVVSINTTATSVNAFHQSVQSASAGSGFLITSDGYIVTNYHVINSADTVKVTLYNGKEYDAKIIGGDEDYDIAVIKIDVTGLTPVTIGNSAALQIGDDIAAIGNPLGELSFSMSEGIVSCVDREINVDGTPFNMIQVTAAINPGNSGGPLFNMYGEVIGIVSAKYSAYANTVAEGLGFAIPINDVIAMVRDIMENGRVTNSPYFAIGAETVTARRAQQNGYSVDEGVRISSMESGGAAERAGLQVGDIIVKLGDREIKDLDDLTAAKKGYHAGDSVNVTVNRGGTEIVVQLTFDAVPETTQQTTTQQQPQDNYNYYYDGNSGYFDPWEFFNDFFGNGGGYGYGYGYGDSGEQAG